MTATTAKETILDCIKQKRHFAEKKVADFAKALDHDTLRAFEWADDAIRSAAMLDVCRMVEAWVGKGVDVGTICRNLTNEVLRKARYPHHSTSLTANLAHESVTSAMAEFLEMLSSIPEN